MSPRIQGVLGLLGVCATIISLPGIPARDHIGQNAVTCIRDLHASSWEIQRESRRQTSEQYSLLRKPSYTLFTPHPPKFCINDCFQMLLRAFETCLQKYGEHTLCSRLLLHWII